jgi:hypothetical protein
VRESGSLSRQQEFGGLALQPDELELSGPAIDPRVTTASKACWASDAGGQDRLQALLRQLVVFTEKGEATRS